MPRKLHRPQAFLKRSLNPGTLLWEGRNLSHMDTSWIMPPSLGSTGKSLDCFIYLYLLYRHSISDNLTGMMIVKLFFFNIFLSLSLLTFWYDLATNNKWKKIQWKSKIIPTAVGNVGNNDIDLKIEHFFSKEKGNYPAETSSSSATHRHLPPLQRYHEQKDDT